MILFAWWFALDLFYHQPCWGELRIYLIIIQVHYLREARIKYECEKYPDDGKAQSHVGDNFQNCFVLLSELCKKKEKVKDKIELVHWAHKIIE